MSTRKTTTLDSLIKATDALWKRAADCEANGDWECAEALNGMAQDLTTLQDGLPSPQMLRDFLASSGSPNEFLILELELLWEATR